MMVAPSLRIPSWDDGPGIVINIYLLKESAWECRVNPMWGCCFQQPGTNGLGEHKELLMQAKQGSHRIARVRLSNLKWRTMPSHVKQPIQQPRLNARYWSEPPAIPNFIITSRRNAQAQNSQRGGRTNRP